jgi:hypothetical protein
MTNKLNKKNAHWLWFLGLVFVVISSCTSTKKITSAPKEDTTKKIEKPKKSIVITEKVDTVQWTNNSKNNPPIKIDEKIGSASTIARNVALFIPFSTQEDKINPSGNLRFLQYYSGVKLAGRKLETEGIKLNIDVFDSENSNFTKQLSKKYEAFIGPYASAHAELSKANLQKVINFGKENKIPVVSPWYSNSKITENNPYYMQLKPNIKEHLVKIVEHISSNFKPSEVVMVGRNLEIDGKWFDYLQELAGAFNPSSTKRPFSEKKVEETDLIGKVDVFKDLIAQGKKVFIFPNHSFSDEKYLASALTKLMKEKGGKDVIVYGMPVILDSDQIGFQFYSALKMRLVVADFYDKDDLLSMDFTRSFFDTFKTIPGKDAMEGYDTMLFLGRAISKHGRSFLLNTSVETGNYLQTSYNIQAVYPEGNDAFKRIDFYENKHLDIIEFSGGRFQRI